MHDVQRSLILEFDVVYLIGRLTIHLYLENDLPPWLSSPRYLEAHLIFLSIFVCHLFLKILFDPPTTSLMRSSFHYYPVKPPYLEGILLLTFQRHLVTLRKDVACQDEQDQAEKL